MKSEPFGERGFGGVNELPECDQRSYSGASERRSPLYSGRCPVGPTIFMTADLPLDKLPSTFYRVTVKALIFDDQDRLLVCVNDEGGYELPGGGLEYGETVEDCLRRELVEELDATLTNVGQIVCLYDMRSPYRNVPVVRIAVHVTITPGELRTGDSIVDCRYVSREEFIALDLKKYEGPVQDFADAIWASATSI